MEVEFIILSALLIILTLICIYCGVKFVIGLGDILAFRRMNKIPNHENDVLQKQRTQKPNSDSILERMQSTPLCESSNNPYNHKDDGKKSNPIPYPFSFILVAHIISIIRRLPTKCKQNHGDDKRE